MSQENSNVQENHTGTADMLEPQTMEYSMKYHLTDVFMNDLQTVLKNSPYIELKTLLDYISGKDRIFTIAQLNEFIRTLASFPYKTICPLMKVIEDKNKFPHYFEIVK